MASAGPTLYTNALPGFFTLSTRKVELTRPLAAEFQGWKDKPRRHPGAPDPVARQAQCRPGDLERLGPGAERLDDRQQAGARVQETLTPGTSRRGSERTAGPQAIRAIGICQSPYLVPTQMCSRTARDADPQRRRDRPSGRADREGAGQNPGRYQNASEVLREGLRLVEQREQEDAAKLERLRAAVDVGIQAMERGEYTEFDSMDDLERHLNALAEKAIAGALKSGSADRSRTAGGRWRVRLSIAANQLRLILHWTTQTFGPKQASDYRQTIVQAVRALEVGRTFRTASARRGPAGAAYCVSPGVVAAAGTFWSIGSSTTARSAAHPARCDGPRTARSMSSVGLWVGFTLARPDTPSWAFGNSAYPAGSGVRPVQTGEVSRNTLAPQRERHLRQNLARLAAVIAAMGDHMGQHLLARHPPGLAVGEGERRSPRQLVRAQPRGVVDPAVGVPDGGRQLVQRRGMVGFVVAVAVLDPLQRLAGKDAVDDGGVIEDQDGRVPFGLEGLHRPGRPWRPAAGRFAQALYWNSDVRSDCVVIVVCP